MFDQLLYPFLNILTFFSWLIPGHNIALSITALTLLVRFILILPSKRAAQAQRKMAQLQPLIEELKTEYGDDKQGLAAAQMELYKKNNASPFGACLPLLIQIPLLLILYRTIYLGLTPNNPHIYSFVPRPDHIGTTLFGIDLLKPDIFYLGGIGIPAILPWLAAIVQYLQVRLTTAPTATTAKVAEGQFDPQAIQKQTALIIPIFTLVIARNFPAGVVVYWIVNTGFSVVQQYFVNKEKLKPAGVEEVVSEVEKQHPEYAKRLEAIEEEIDEEVKSGKLINKPLPAPLRSETKKGVTVTVRKKSDNK